MDGREACRLMRKNGVTAPVIMLTAAASDSDTILGLESGANDYVTKPFRFGVLLARIRAQLRSYEASEDALFRIGPYEFRPSAKLLIDEKQKKVRLTEKETNILKYLYRAGSKPVSREELLTEVWGYNAGVTTHTLETHVYRLRQKIEPDPAVARILITEMGGYRLQPCFDRPKVHDCWGRAHAPVPVGKKKRPRPLERPGPLSFSAQRDQALPTTTPSAWALRAA
jgi:DNA-binding response OmpR family regulator